MAARLGLLMTRGIAYETTPGVADETYEKLRATPERPRGF